MRANLHSTCCLGVWITAQGNLAGTRCDENPPKKVTPAGSGGAVILSGCRLSMWGAGAECQRGHGAESCTSSRLMASHPTVQPVFGASCKNRSKNHPGPLFQELQFFSEGARPGQACASQNLAMPGPSLPFLSDKGAPGDREGSSLQAQRCLQRSGVNVFHGLISYLRRE